MEYFTQTFLSTQTNVFIVDSTYLGNSSQLAKKELYFSDFEKFMQCFMKRVNEYVDQKI